MKMLQSSYLINSGQRIWLEHSEPKIDVVLIPVSLDENKFVISKMNTSFIEENDELLVQFERILVVGYPFGWYDDKYNLPIVRVGHLSSPFKMWFKEEPVMLGDAITHAGMSGSPVMMLLRNPVTRDKHGKLNAQLGYKYILAGIYSGQFKIHGEFRKHLIKIWFPEVIKWIHEENSKVG